MRTRGFLLLAFVLLVTPACRRRKTTAQSDAGAFTQSYKSENGLITVHYPPDFAAKKVGKSVIVVSRNFSDGTDEAIAFTPIETPISNDLNEFARVVDIAETETLNRYTEKSKQPGLCGPSPAIETTGRWIGKQDGTVYERRSCIFLHNGHGFAFTYSVPEKHATAELALMKKMIAATDFNR